MSLANSVVRSAATPRALLTRQRLPPLIMVRPHHGRAFIEAIEDDQPPSRGLFIARWILGFSIAFFGGTILMLSALNWLAQLA